jgi:expansin (peptidoglycan-binding protein)
MVAAINTADYEHAALCGACLEVAGPRGKIVVRVVDSCPGCKHGDLDLSREAFARLAPLDLGRIAITWQVVACDVRGPLAYHFKDGSNPFWTGIQVRDHRYPIATLEAWDAHGTLHDIKRADYNYFVAQGLGAGPYAFRVTDARGHSHVDAFVPLAAERTFAGASQLPACR